MLAYLAFVTKLKIDNANWALYDMNFRQDRENTRAAWEIPSPDLRNETLQHFKRNTPTNSSQNEEKFCNPRKGYNPAQRYGFCLDYNRKTSYCKKNQTANINTHVLSALKATRSSSTVRKQKTDKEPTSKNLAETSNTATTPIATDVLNSLLQGYNHKDNVI